MRFSIDPQTTVLRARSGQPVAAYLSKKPDVFANANAVRDAFAESQPGDELYVAPGTYFFEHSTGNVKVPDVIIYGAGAGRTVFQSDVWSDAQQTGFALRNTRIQGVTLQHLTDYQPREDGRCTGFDPEPGQTTPFSAKLVDCEIIGDAWTVYNWNNLGNKLYLLGCTIKFGRLGLAAMGSGSASSQFFTAERCLFDGDASRAIDIGATSNILYGGVYGAVCRGGNLKLIDCAMYLRGKVSVGPSYTPVVYGVSDTFELTSDGKPVGASSSTKIELYNLQCTTVANESTKVKDINFSFPNIKAQSIIVGGRGSGPGGAFIGL